MKKIWVLSDNVLGPYLPVMVSESIDNLATYADVPGISVWTELGDGSFEIRLPTDPHNRYRHLVIQAFPLI